MLNPRLQRINFSHLARRQAQFGGMLITLSIVGVSGGHNKFGALVVEFMKLKSPDIANLLMTPGGPEFRPIGKSLLTTADSVKRRLTASGPRMGKSSCPMAEPGPGKSSSLTGQ